MVVTKNIKNELAKFTVKVPDVIGETLSFMFLSDSQSKISLIHIQNWISYRTEQMLLLKKSSNQN